MEMSFPPRRSSIMLSMVVAPAVMIQQGVGYEGDHSAYAVIALSREFINHMLIAFFFAIDAIFFNRDRRRYAALALMFLIATMRHFAQFRLLTAIILAPLWGYTGRKVAVSSVALLLLLYGVGMNFIPEAMVKGPSAPARLRRNPVGC
jgi:hypothetical protein